MLDEKPASSDYRYRCRLPLGNDVDSTWQNLLARKSGLSTIRQFDASAFPTYIAAEVKQFTLRKTLANKQNRYVMPFTGFALEAASQAFEDAGILPTEQSASRWGVVAGSGMMTQILIIYNDFNKLVLQKVMLIGRVCKLIPAIFIN